MAVAPVGAQDAGVVDYADLAPILAERCVLCHRGDAAPAGLRLDSLEALLAGGENGPVVRAGDPEGSELIRRLRGRSQPRMPLTGPPFLSDAQIARFERWVAAGLPAGEAPSPPSAPPLPTPDEPVTYARVAPVLASHCARCHAPRGLMGEPPEGLDLTSHATTLAGGERVVVVPGHPLASELLRRVRGQARPRMPYDGPPYLSEEETRLLERWIAQGARDARGRAAAIPTGARVRLHGRLDGRWSLDGLPLEVGPGTRIDDAPGAGDRVRVRGRLRHDGGIAVERLGRR